jgi:hypothetical protein
MLWRLFHIFFCWYLLTPWNARRFISIRFSNVRRPFIQTLLQFALQNLSFQVSAFWKRNHALMFCWPRITVYQESETNVIHFLIILLRIKSFYIFRALLTHPQEALGTLRACYVIWLHQFHSNLGAANWHNTHAIHEVAFVQRFLRMSK